MPPPRAAGLFDNFEAALLSAAYRVAFIGGVYRHFSQVLTIVRASREFRYAGHEVLPFARPALYRGRDASTTRFRDLV